MECRKCGSTKFVRFGFIVTVKNGKRQRYRCEHGHTRYGDKTQEVIK